MDWILELDEWICSKSLSINIGIFFDIDQCGVQFRTSNLSCIEIEALKVSSSFNTFDVKYIQMADMYQSHSLASHEAKKKQSTEIKEGTAPTSASTNDRISVPFCHNVGMKLYKCNKKSLFLNP